MVEGNRKLQNVLILISFEASKWLSAEIEKVQNPTNCDNAKWHLCVPYNNCGGGCVVHQLAYCFLVGFATHRITYIYDGWSYLRQCEGGSSWSCLFQPMTRCPIPNEVYQKDAAYESNIDGAKVSTVTLFSRGVGANFVRWAASDGFHTNTPFWLPSGN